MYALVETAAITIIIYKCIYEFAGHISVHTSLSDGSRHSNDFTYFCCANAASTSTVNKSHYEY